MLGYMDALDRVGMRTVLIFFSAKVDRPTRYRHSTNGNLITVLPVPAHYRALRRRLSGYVAGPARAVGPHLSTPLMALARELRREECRVILCQEYEYFRFDACVALGRLLRLPVFATFQGSDFEHNPLSRAVKAAVIRRSAGLLIAPSTEIERVHQAYGSNGPRVFQVFNPVDADEWGGGEREEARRALGLGAGTRVAVWHGRVAIHSKGLDLLLDAWERVCKERPGGDLRLMLIGTGQD